ncbi:MAG: aa3-type cytochrome c oxidase subunit IV [Yoonia sp.]
MAEYKHGEMDITAQEKTFEGFMNLTTKAAIGIIVFLIFLALIAV